MFPVQPALEDPYRIPEISASIEISLGSATIRIANGADPAILDRVLSLVRGTICQAISPWRTTSISCAAQLICASASMVSAALSGINFLWTQTSPPCSCSVGNDVTGSRSCSTNQMDMFSFIKAERHTGLVPLATEKFRSPGNHLASVELVTQRTGHRAAQSNPDQLKKHRETAEIFRRHFDWTCG